MKMHWNSLNIEVHKAKIGFFFIYFVRSFAHDSLSCSAVHMNNPINLLEIFEWTGTGNSTVNQYKQQGQRH